MRSHELSGVVDPRLEVHGTDVRVADARELSFQIDGHVARFVAVFDSAGDMAYR